MFQSLCKPLNSNSDLICGLKARESGQTLHSLGAYLIEKSLKVNFTLDELEGPSLNFIKIIWALR